jgi:hypothetical protein
VQQIQCPKNVIGLVVISLLAYYGPTNSFQLSGSESIGSEDLVEDLVSVSVSRCFQSVLQSHYTHLV